MARPKKLGIPLLASGRQWLEVLASKFTRKQLLYAQWLAFREDPEKLQKIGLPTSQEDFCQAIGVERRTVWNWERGVYGKFTRDDFWDLVAIYAREGAKEYLAAAYTTIGLEAKKRNFKAAQALIDLMGRQDEHLSKLARKAPGMMAPALNEVKDS
jgi:transcriptional regulator with XRE-family HTH domain